MRKIFLILFLLVLPSLLPYFNPQFFYTQDHIFIARLQQMHTALLDGQFPVRWSPDLRFGEPLFNFYAPLPFYIGSLIKLLGFNYIWVSKILFILSTILSALTMFILCKRLFSEKAAFLAAALYTYAPYRAVDLYVRGALSEAWAFIFFPLIFYTSLLLSEKINFKRVAFLSLSLAGLFLTHNVTTLMFLPFLFLWWLYLLITTKKWKIIISFLGSFILSIGLAAFFILPALYERQFIQTQYLIVGYFDFRAHFVAFYQFFSTFWGYGSSLWGPIDDISFQIGLVHWAVLVLALIIGFIHRKKRKVLMMLGFFGFMFLISLFFQHNKSAFVWEAIPLMAYIQFPWRFLAFSIFIVALVGAATSDYFKGRFLPLYFLLIAATILINLQYFRPRNFVDDSFFDKFLDKESTRKGVDLTKDYLPTWIQTVDGEVFETLRAEKGEIDVKETKKRSTMLASSVNVATSSSVEAPITFFPGWEVSADGKPLSQNLPSKMGLIRFELPKGQHQVKIEFKDTPVRIAGNLISIISILIVFSVLRLKRFNLK